MTAALQLPPEATAWLREVERELAPLAEPSRRDVLTGLAEHVAESVEAGLPVDEVLLKLGAPKAIAEQTFQQVQQETGVDPRFRYFTLKRVLQFVAAALALAAALAVALLPSYIEVSTTDDGRESITASTVLQVVGPWFLLVLAVPLAIALLPLPARGRAWQPLSVVAAVLLGLFSLVGVLSIGWYFLPATIVSIVAAFAPTRRRK